MRLTDGYTGKEVDGKALSFRIDGVPEKAVTKAGGYCVFTGLSAGTHTIWIESVPYRTETFTFETGKDLIPVILKPGKNYIYPPKSTCFTIENREEAIHRVWIGRDSQEAELKIAQSDLKEGDDSLKLYATGKASELPMPGHFLIIDGEQTEPVTLLEIAGEEKSPLAKPVTSSHKRGCRLVPAQFYEVGAKESTEIRFPENTGCVFWVPASKILITPETSRGVILIGEENHGK